MTDPIELGYYFYPSRDPEALGHPGLDVRVYAEPTTEHYDAERAEFRILGSKGNLEELIIVHPWGAAEQYQVCLGRIVLRDRKDKVVQAFSFGGELSIQVEPDYTLCRLRSDLPILDLVGEEGLELFLVSEIEVILSELRAGQAVDDDDIERALCAIEPVMLYATILSDLELRLKVLQNDESDHRIHDGLLMIQHELGKLRSSQISEIEARSLAALLYPPA